MIIQESELSFQENIIFRLRSLFEAYGYSRYKMNKFEEYDLYAKNKDFLLSDSVITFTDFNGKLMALKPDVTLSIVKNSRDDTSAQQKLYYNENVYRADRSGHSFREMMQMGLECIGDVDDACILEVLLLAAKSLKTVDENCVLDISHLGILRDAMDAVGIPDVSQDRVLRFLAKKNLHELKVFCRSCGVAEEKIQWFHRLISASGTAKTVLPVIRSLLEEISCGSTAEQLEEIVSVMETAGYGEMLRFDFSALDDSRYYNGIMIKGYIHGLPNSVLSGGQYDNLMRKMNRKSSAMGFAIYVDRLEQLEPRRKNYDVDALLLYDGRISLAELERQTARLREQGIRVLVQRQMPEGIRYRKLLKLNPGEVEILEDNA